VVSERGRAAFEILKSAKLSEEHLQALRILFKEGSVGVIHSLFVLIDGGTALASEGKALELIDFKTGLPLTEAALHENFIEVVSED
jgi:hypothetical protein